MSIEKLFLHFQSFSFIIPLLLHSMDDHDEAPTIEVAIPPPADDAPLSEKVIYRVKSVFANHERNVFAYNVSFFLVSVVAIVRYGDQLAI